MKNILEEIVAFKSIEVKAAKKSRALNQLKDSIYFNRPCKSLSKAILSKKRFGIIAEIKRKSPSKGWINKDIDIVKLADDYQKNNAAAISVLTDKHYFGGKNEYLTQVKETVTIPILRKDFIIDAYQIYESKAIGADCILLIAACLSIEKCKDLARMAQALGLEVLLEIHNQNELSYLNDSINLVGVNNRNLKTFKTAISQAIELCKHIPEHITKISESGIDGPDKIKQLVRHKYTGFLIGEYFMQSNSIANGFKILYNEN